VPASRSIERIHGRLRAGDGDASRRNTGPRLRPAFELERGVDLAQIGEAWHESEKIDGVRSAAVARDHLVDRESS